MGDGARVGANAVALKSVPAGVTVVGIPAEPVLPRQFDGSPEFHAYGTPTTDLDHPAVKIVAALNAEIAALRTRIEALEDSREGPPGEQESEPDCSSPSCS